MKFIKKVMKPSLKMFYVWLIVMIAFLGILAIIDGQSSEKLYALLIIVVAANVPFVTYVLVKGLKADKTQPLREYEKNSSKRGIAVVLALLLFFAGAALCYGLFTVIFPPLITPEGAVGTSAYLSENSSNSHAVEDDQTDLGTRTVFGSYKIEANQVKSIEFISIIDTYDLPSSWNRFNTICFDASENQDKSIIVYAVSDNDDMYSVYVASRDTIVLNENSSGLFASYINLESIEFNDVVSSYSVTDMSYMFYNCRNLTHLDLSWMNTADVTNMRGMFEKCERLQNLDVSTLDTANVTDMSLMFRDCQSLSTLNMALFDTANVTDMDGMFYCCHSLSELDLSRFDTANVTSMYAMFEGCHSLDSLDLSSFDTANVTRMDYMFKNCCNLKGLRLDAFNSENLNSLDSMFEQCRSLNYIVYSQNFSLLSYLKNNSEPSCDITRGTKWEGILLTDLPITHVGESLLKLE